MSKKKEKAGYVKGSPQCDNTGLIRIDDSGDNFVFMNYMEHKNWQDYFFDKQLDEKIDSVIRNSIYKEVYESGGIINSSLAIDIYYYVKNKLKKEFSYHAEFMIFFKVMFILGVKINNIMGFIPNEEIEHFKTELNKKGLYKPKQKQLF